MNTSYPLADSPSPFQWLAIFTLELRAFLRLAKLPYDLLAQIIRLDLLARIRDRFHRKRRTLA